MTRDQKAGTLTVNLPGDVLFPAGQAELKESAKTTLNKVASAIKKDYSTKKLIVQGYTDKDPISRTKDKWTDNLDLSAARAARSRRILAARALTRKSSGFRRTATPAPRPARNKAAGWRSWC